MATLEWSDYLAIVLYFVIVLGVGFWVSRLTLYINYHFTKLVK